MKSKKELYQIVLIRYKVLLAKVKLDRNAVDITDLYLCNCFKLCETEELITKDEYTFIFEDFVSNRPKGNKFKEFKVDGLYKIPSNIPDKTDCWWGLAGSVFNDGLGIREKFLQKLVDKSK